MTIHPPEDLEAPILKAVHSGRFASLDDAMAEAALMLVERPRREQVQPETSACAHPSVDTAGKPIWEEILEVTADVPDEVWDALPTDLAEQHDRYLYGTPKRPTT